MKISLSKLVYRIIHLLRKFKQIEFENLKDDNKMWTVMRQ